MILRRSVSHSASTDTIEARRQRPLEDTRSAGHLQAPGRSARIGGTLEHPRLYRASSWLRRASSLAATDLDGRFIFLWIALNALFGQARYRPDGGDPAGEWGDLEQFLRRLGQLDESRGRIPTAMRPLREPVIQLLSLPFLHRSYWVDGHTDGLDTRLQQDCRRAGVAWERGRPETCLREIFRRLYVLRNQIFHGASTDRSSANRDSLEGAVPVLAALVPVFRSLMRDEPANDDWGPIPYVPRRREGHPPDRRSRFNPPRLVGR
jgi:hypothetical protein